MNRMRSREGMARARQDLWRLIERDELLAHVASTAALNADEDLEHLWSNLLLSGGGQWTRNGYVPALSFADGGGFAYLALSARQPLPEGWDEYNRWLHITVNLVRYFNQEIARPVPLPTAAGPADMSGFNADPP
jgi:hypothetical protein